MAFSSATVSVGGVTRQSDYQRVMDNTIALKSEDIELDGTKTFNNPIASKGITVPVLHVQDQKTANVDGGTNSAGTNIRDLNTVIRNTITGASLSSNKITLPAGTYIWESSAPSFRVLRFFTEIYNVTDSVRIFRSRNGIGITVTGSQIDSIMKYIFTLTGTKDIELRHYTEVSVATNGFGLGSSSELGESIEIYSDVFIEKIG